MEKKGEDHLIIKDDEFIEGDQIEINDNIKEPIPSQMHQTDIQKESKLDPETQYIKDSFLSVTKD